MIGVLGIDSIDDKSYQDYLIMYKPSEDTSTENTGLGGGPKKYSLYPFGMSEKLFQPKGKYEHLKEVF
jgi:hypothetical protein